MLLEQRDLAVPRTIQEALDNCIGTVGYREHAPVRLGFESDSETRKPVNCVRWLPLVKGGTQLARAARIGFYQFAGIVARVRHIAAPPAGNPNFLQEVPAFLENRDALSRGQFRVSQSGEKARSTPADDSKVQAGRAE